MIVSLLYFPTTAAPAPAFAKTSLVVPGKPRATLDALYAAIPYYQRKVVRFQEAFACPNVWEQREAEARKGQGKRDATGIDGDCNFRRWTLTRSHTHSYTHSYSNSYTHSHSHSYTHQLPTCVTR